MYIWYYIWYSMKTVSTGTRSFTYDIGAGCVKSRARKTSGARDVMVAGEHTAVTSARRTPADRRKPRPPPPTPPRVTFTVLLPWVFRLRTTPCGSGGGSERAAPFTRRAARAAAGRSVGGHTHGRRGGPAAARQKKSSARTPYPNGEQNADRCGRARTWNLYLRNITYIQYRAYLSLYRRRCGRTHARAQRDRILIKFNIIIVSSGVPRKLRCRRRRRRRRYALQ